MKSRSAYPISGLFEQYVPLEAGQRVLLLNHDNPALARWALEAVNPGGSVTALHPSSRALAALRRVTGAVTSDTVYPTASEHGPADVALLEIPKGREHARATLWTAAAAMRPGGVLYLAGPNSGGAKTAIKDAATLCGAAVVLGYRGGQRIARAEVPAELRWPADWGEAKPWELQPRTITLSNGDEYHIQTLPGIFSWDHLDDGSGLLLDYVQQRGVFQPDQRVLDLGCGWGILGLAAARAGAQATLIDDNLLAVRCADINAAQNGLSERVSVLPGDLTAPVADQRFDLVISNPPFHEGHAQTTGITERLVREAHAVLRPGGVLLIVANTFLPYKSLMRDQFGAVEVRTETPRYRVLASVRT